MINVKINFKNSHQDLTCLACKADEDSQEHMMLNCTKLNNKLTKKEYFTMFGSDEDKMAEVVKKVEKIVAERSDILGK